MFISKVKELLEEALLEREDLFLIDFSVTGENNISIIIDGDQGVTVEDCIFISRAIEHNIDREEHDFALEVASGGATTPLKLPRQYKKNIGRDLEVKTATETITAKLVSASDEAIELEWKAREPKPVGKGKVTVQKKANIAYNDILEAKVMIKF
ncbi:ribosome assembly cofactor RimP [Bizionia paragorgiae]|uniref:Ribosome maturation factor RimP n=1 Tax=Bizionia paragorgiae TaxID=283786 RepID=A0A1H4BTK8_BIZPA|nr:ribosome assembly cofactor RimP [Bizionia paragorgiae]MDX1271696.1 ribosome assembly cofactor RimP [Bizionia paragorgiae]SEA51434.1 ribosome maturation factor RimP [Bizionia paragorgiae]